MAINLETTPSTKSAQDARNRVSGGGASLVPKRAPSSRDRMFFTEQLALLLETGESLHTALAVVAHQYGETPMGAVVGDIVSDVSQGTSFSAALGRHPDVFSATYTNLVAASEKGGFMADVLQQLLDMDRKREDLQKAIVSAATYPVFLILFSVAVVVFVLVAVFPKFDSMFASIYDELPVSTRALMAVSQVMREYWVAIVAAVAVSFVGLRQYVKSDTGGRHFDALKLSSALTRRLFVQIYLTQVLPVLGMSLANGVTAVDALRSSRDVVGNRLFRELVDDVRSRVESGESIAAGFEGVTFMPDLVKHMIGTGEKSGKLGPVLLRLSVYYESELRKRLDVISKMAEPVMLLVMGVVVGILVSSLILPIFKLSTSAG